VSEAEEIATKTFFGTMMRWGTIRNFRRVAELGLPNASATLLRENQEFAERVRDSSGMDRWFTNREEFMRVSGGVERLAETLTGTQRDQFQAAVDAASLIYAHSLVDAAAHDYLRACRVVAPTDFLQLMGDRKVSLRDVSTSTFDEVLRPKLNDYLSELERESLITKVEKLFALSQPPAGFDPVENYAYDPDRLKRLDEKRHDLVHGAGPAAPIPTIDADLEFLERTQIFLFTLVNERYGIKLDSRYMQFPASGSSTP
jgi:hypothetical protein